MAHFHYVLIGCMVLPIFAALYYWTLVIIGMGFTGTILAKVLSYPNVELRTRAHVTKVLLDSARQRATVEGSVSMAWFLLYSSC